MADILHDVFAVRMNVNADPTLRTGTFNTGASITPISSTNATPPVFTIADTTLIGGVGTYNEVFIAGHLVNTNANGVYYALIIDATTFSLKVKNQITGAYVDAVGNGVGGATGTIYFQPARWVPIFEDGFQVGERVKKVVAKTQHKDRGARYSWTGHRNRDLQQVRTPIYPENAAFLLNLPIATQAGTFLPQYNAAEEYWDGTLGTGTANFGASGVTTNNIITGRQCLGMVYGGWTLTFDRESENELELSLDVLLNAEQELTSAFPAIPTSSTVGYAYLGWPAQNPYRHINAYIDFEFALGDGTFTTGWTGDRLDLISSSIKFAQTPTPHLSRTSTTPAYSGTWSKLYSQTPTVDFQTVLTMSNSDYLRITGLVALRKARVRFMAVGDNPSGVTTSATNLAAGGTTLVVASVTGFHPGDMIMLEQPVANRQQVVQITAINSGTSTFTTTPADVAMDASGAGEDMVVRNTAFQVKVPTMDLENRSPPQGGTDLKTISIAGSAILTPATTTLMQILAYNDDFAGYPSV